ncbi:unnamed protein product [Amoebophrya sp. A25]|nr:unnamed protein product [Amoebophrya sp. A25]|eukprot:GSA25T00013291001.1
MLEEAERVEGEGMVNHHRPSTLEARSRRPDEMKGRARSTTQASSSILEAKSGSTRSEMKACSRPGAASCSSTRGPATQVFFVYGPMFAGKTSMLIRLGKALERADNKRVCVVRPSFDTRYGEDRLCAHPPLQDPQFLRAQAELQLLFQRRRRRKQKMKMLLQEDINDQKKDTTSFSKMLQEDNDQKDTTSFSNHDLCTATVDNKDHQRNREMKLGKISEKQGDNREPSISLISQFNGMQLSENIIQKSGSSVCTEDTNVRCFHNGRLVRTAGKKSPQKRSIAVGDLPQPSRSCSYDSAPSLSSGDGPSMFHLNYVEDARQHGHHHLQEHHVVQLQQQVSSEEACPSSQDSVGGRRSLSWPLASQEASQEAALDQASLPCRRFTSLQELAMSVSAEELASHNQGLSFSFTARTGSSTSSTSPASRSRRHSVGEEGEEDSWSAKKRRRTLDYKVQVVESPFGVVRSPRLGSSQVKDDEEQSEEKQEHNNHIGLRIQETTSLQRKKLTASVQRRSQEERGEVKRRHVDTSNTRDRSAYHGSTLGHFLVAASLPLQEQRSAEVDEVVLLIDELHLFSDSATPEGIAALFSIAGVSKVVAFGLEIGFEGIMPSAGLLRDQANDIFIRRGARVAFLRVPGVCPHCVDQASDLDENVELGGDGDDETSRGVIGCAAGVPGAGLRAAITKPTVIAVPTRVFSFEDRVGGAEKYRSLCEEHYAVYLNRTLPDVEYVSATGKVLDPSDNRAAMADWHEWEASLSEESSMRDEADLLSRLLA